MTTQRKGLRHALAYCLGYVEWLCILLYTRRRR